MANFEKLYEDSILPLRKTKTAAGYDFYAHEEIDILPHSRGIVKTGVSCKLADNEYLAVTPRSGLAIKKGVTVLNTPGTVDSDYYPGEICVILFNTSDEVFHVQIGDRIAQAIISEYITTENDNVADTERHGGFGSTGV